MSKLRMDVSLSLRLPEKLFGHLQEVAGETDTSMAYHIRRALEIYFDESYVDAEKVALLEESGDSEEYISGDKVRSILGLEKKPASPANGINLVDAFLTDVTHAIENVATRYHVTPKVSHEKVSVQKKHTKSARKSGKEGRETRISHTR